MLKSSLTLLPVAALLAVVWPAVADTITLKSGAKIEGKILSETATEVTVEYRESAGIVDRKTLKREEIASIAKETPDVAAWEAIKGARPGANSLPAAQYDFVLPSIKAFIGAYPASVFLEEAKKNAAAFEEEKKRVDAGEVKIANRWLTLEEAEKERYQINGVIAFNYMKSQASGGDLMGALNTFAQIEKNYGGSASFPDAVELAAKILPTLKATVERAYQNLKTEALGRQQAAPQSRAELEAAAKRDEEAGAASIVAAEKAGMKWPPLNIRSSKSLAKIAEKLAPETARLAALPLPAMRQSIAAAEAAKAGLGTGDLEAAASALAVAKVWEPNELAKRLSTEIAEAKKAAMEAAKVVVPVATPKPVEAPPAPKVETKPVRTAAAPVIAEPVAEKPFYMTTAGIASIVGGIAAVLIAVRVINAIRARRNDDE